MPTPTIDGHASNKAYVDNEISKISDASDNSNYVKKSGDTMTGSLLVQKYNYPIQGDLNKVISYETQREIFLSKHEESPMKTDLNMNNHHISNLKLPSNPDHACNKNYLDTELNHKVNRNELRDYIKTDGSTSMVGDLDMSNNRIKNLPDPHFSNEPATKNYINTITTHLGTIFLDRLGKNKMLGNIDMNQHKIINTIEPVDDLDISNKKYTDNQITKSHIKSNSLPSNIFKYLMSSPDQFSTEYNVRVNDMINLNESPHNFNKRVLSIEPIKDDDNNYRFRLSLNAFRLKHNGEYTLIIELYNKDYETWYRQLTFVNGLGIWVEAYHTEKFQHMYNVNDTIYYSKTIKFKITSSSAPIEIFITYHFDDKSGDMNTYPNQLQNVYILAYGINGLSDHVSSEVYDKHNSFEILNNKLKILVELDMNQKSIKNIANLSNNGIISIYSKLNFNGFLKSNNDIQIKFDNVYINSIFIKPSLENRGKISIVNINTPDVIALKYPFQFSNSPNTQRIVINRFFTKVYNIQVTNCKNNPYILQYSIFY